MKTCDARIERSLLARFVHDLVNGFGFFLQYLLDVRGMNAAVHGQAGQCSAGDFTPYRIKA